MRILATLMLLLTLAACGADDPSSGPYVGGGVGGNTRTRSLH